MSKRAALALAPTYDCVTDGLDAYVDPFKLRVLAKKHGRFWAFHEVPTTVALPNNRFAKNLKPFTSHTTEPEFRELLAEFTALGVPRPSGYADVFHDRYQSPRIEWSVNAILAPVFAGGWQDALRLGVSKGTHYKYDMRSAYLWAATLGMPDHTTYRRSVQPWRHKQGVYRVRLLEPSRLAPFPFNRAMEVLASPEEIERYNLRIGKVVDGCTWRGVRDARKIIDTIKLVSTWKQAARAYWGRWAQLQKVQCVSGERKWTLPNLQLNIPWAHTIVERVRTRLWEAAQGGAVHVFVDSVITPRQLATGDELGDWRLEKTYHRGVLVRAPGWYGDPHSDKLERMAGVPLDSTLRLLRNLSIVVQ